MFYLAKHYWYTLYQLMSENIANEIYTARDLNHS
jgi:hypothetical protein